MRKGILLLVFGLGLGVAGFAQDEEELKKVEKEIREQIAANEKKGGLGKLTAKLKKDDEEGVDAKDMKPKKVEKRENENYEKSLNDRRPVYEDKYGRPLNSGPRFESDAKLKRINRKNEKTLNPKPSRKDRKPSRKRYRYD